MDGDDAKRPIAAPSYAVAELPMFDELARVGVK